MTITFDGLSPEEAAEVKTIVARAHSAFPTRNVLDIEMDVVATHLNGCPLNFQKLLAFGDFDFLHDIAGIERHLNRRTAQLTSCFIPRCAR